MIAKYVAIDPSMVELSFEHKGDDRGILLHKQMTIYYLLGNIAFIELDHTQLVAKMTRV
ncbi:MinE [Vibrio cholerae]|nr:MinE [Vibrio cholerae]